MAGGDQQIAHGDEFSDLSMQVVHNPIGIELPAPRNEMNEENVPGWSNRAIPGSTLDVGCTITTVRLCHLQSGVDWSPAPYLYDVNLTFASLTCHLVKLQ